MSVSKKSHGSSAEQETAATAEKAAAATVPPARDTATAASASPAAAGAEATTGAATTNGQGATAVATPPAEIAPVMPRVKLRTASSIPADFRFGEALGIPHKVAIPELAPSLGPLAAFVGNWSGTGFNMIFRPNSPTTPTALPTPAGGDNVLELNLTSETLSFSPSLGSVPNRGMVQADAFLNGVPYLQSVSDITSGRPIGLHLEPGLWMIVPATTDPAEGQTLVRMGSIPHGTTIVAQGGWHTFAGAPTIPPVDITPFGAIDPGGSPGGRIRFSSQTATAPGTARIPQDLTPFISAGTITQAILDDPNTVLRDHLSGQTISHTTVITVSTAPSGPVFGGGTDNIAFLLGDTAALANPRAAGQNAQTIEMTATFWIEEVEHRIVVPPFVPGHPPLHLRPDAATPGQPVPTFEIRPPIPIPEPRPITVTSAQIQYSQTVLLNFNGLSWPHVTVATLVPDTSVVVPPTVWS